MHGQSHINKFTNKLRMRKQMEWSHAWSESNQQVHILPGNEIAKWNGKMRGQSQINNFTYFLEM